MKPLLDWIDDRTGYRGIAKAMLFEHIPGGSRWRYVWGSTLVFCFVTQMVTGLFLWMAYSPSSQTAWESVYYIQHVMTGGWLLRGIHHYTAHMMVVLLVLHMAQVVIDGAYRAPREFNFWIGLVLMMLILGLSLTGYLLPWDQKGYWATQVATNLMAIVPVVGPKLQQIVVGGSSYGHHTLTRFFALHAGLLPFLVLVFIGLHVYLFRRHGITYKVPKQRPDETFWVDQVLKDAVACLGVLLTVLLLCVYRGVLEGDFGNTHNVGAELGAPADPSESYNAARPEWYFFFLFQLLKYFPGQSEVWGAVYIPTLVLAVLFVMPIIGRWKAGHRFNVAFLAVLLAAVGVLTSIAIAQDLRKPEYKLAVDQAHRDAHRVIVLAKSPVGIPPTGAVALLRNDAYTQGPRLFAQHCSTCHRYDGHNGLGGVPDSAQAQSAPDLKGFGSREWIAGLLDPAKVDSVQYFGGTKFKKGEMVEFVKEDVAEYKPAEKEALTKVIAALSAEAKLEAQRELDQKDAAAIDEGRKLLLDGTTITCADCHRVDPKAAQGEAPDLVGYASREWLVGILNDPTHRRFYGKRNDRMPAFGAKQLLDERQINLIVDWLRGEWYEPGRTVAAEQPATRPTTQPTTTVAVP